MLKIGLWGNFLLHRTFSFSLRCYLYYLPDMWRKICHVEKFQISLRDKCGEIWYFSTWGVFSRNAIWDVDKSKISPLLAYVWWGEWLHMCEIHAFLLQNWFCCNLHTFVADFFVAIYAFLCGKKINQQLRSWRKNDKYQVCFSLHSSVLGLQSMVFSPQSSVLNPQSIVLREDSLTSTDLWGWSDVWC